MKIRMKGKHSVVRDIEVIGEAGCTSSCGYDPNIWEPVPEEKKTMKIRMKNDHAEVREVVLLGSDMKHVWALWEYDDPFTGRQTQYFSSHWEPVPEEVWEDVTDECEVIHHYPNATDEIWRKGDRVTTHGCQGYRLRDVKVNTGTGNLASYFIVERKRH